MAHYEIMYDERVLVPDPIDEEFGFRPPPGVLRRATGLEEEFGTADPHVISGIDIEFGDVPGMIARHRATAQNRPTSEPA